MAVRVTPRASRERVEAVDDSVRVYVTAPPADNEANDAVCTLVAKTLRVPKGSISVARGHKSRDKTLDLGDLTADEALARLRGVK